MTVCAAMLSAGVDGVLHRAAASNAGIERAPTVKMRIVNQSMTDVSSTLSSLSGIPVTAYGPLKGTVENWSVDGPALDVFNELGRRTHTFVAYDGNRIIMASADEVTISIIELGTRNETSAMNIVHVFFPITPPGAVVYDREVSALVVRGPKQFADAIEAGVARAAHAPGQRIKIVKYGTKEFVTSDDD